MTWTTAPDSVARARELLDEVGRDISNMPYELALYGLTRSGATKSHRELAAGYLRLHERLAVDTQCVGSHS
jgi:hypothetical protein